jgi:colanic acid/amylovoran biosynthesis glycosyltransferase
MFTAFRIKLQKLKIAFFVSEFPALSETFIVNQIVDIKSRGHSVHIYASSRSRDAIIHDEVLAHGLMNDVAFLNNLPRERFPKIMLLLKSLFQNLSYRNLRSVFKFSWDAHKKGLSVYSLVHFLGKPHYDVVHAHFGKNGNYVFKLKELGLFPKSRFVTTFHGYDLEIEAECKQVYSDLFERCDMFTVNSDFSKEKLLGLGCPPKKIRKIPVGLEINYFKPEVRITKINKTLKLLFVGRLVPFKGPDRVVEICRYLKTNTRLSFHMQIVGDGEMRNTLAKMIKDFSLENEVNLIGPKSQAEIVELMKSSDIFLYPARTVDGRSENQGLVLQEAQAMGLPVIISNAGGMKEGVIDQVTGFVIEENNLEKFAIQVELIAKDVHRRRKMAVQAREFVEKNFSITLLNNRLLSIYSGNEN